MRVKWKMLYQSIESLRTDTDIRAWFCCSDTLKQLGLIPAKLYLSGVQVTAIYPRSNLLSCC